MQQIFRILLLFTASLSLSPVLSEQTRVLASGPNKVHLVELYTSEGCSSCPPADRWFNTQIERQGLWQTFVPVAFHVDYWDYIGWPDRFADPDHTRRQQQIARTHRQRTIYTPEVVLNGKPWRAWRNQEIPVHTSETPGELQLEKRGNELLLTFMPAEDGNGPYTVHVVLLGFDLYSDVDAGENSGHKLEHNFVALEHHRLDMDVSKNGYYSKTTLPHSKVDANKKAIAAWISKSGQTTPLQAVGGWL